MHISGRAFIIKAVKPKYRLLHKPSAARVQLVFQISKKLCGLTPWKISRETTEESSCKKYSLERANITEANSQWNPSLYSTNKFPRYL